MSEITIHVKEFISAEQLQKDVQIDSTNLDDEIIRHAGLFSHYAAMASRAQQQADDMKMLREAMYGKLFEEYRNTAIQNNEKVTEKLIESRIFRDLRYITAVKRLNRARALQELTKSACEAFRQRRDMLVQTGVRMREEMKGELRVREIEAHDAAYQSKRQRALDTVSKAKNADEK